MLVEILGPENPGTYGTFNDYFWTWPIATFIELFGLGQEAISLRALEEVTKRGTGEFAVRPYIRQNPTGLLKIMTAWSQDDNFHLRRLSSEGLRPLLPWSQKLTLFIDDPTPLRAILEHLKNDPSRYVQKSVANHINDYLKVNHDFGRSIIDEWSDQPGINTRWIIKHAIRNYRKKEEAWAIALTARMNN
jgi:3-methyladenine DNA glycosylase AlkC